MRFIKHRINIVAYLLAAVLFFTAVWQLTSQNHALAFSGGGGTSGNPYLIANCADLAAVDTSLSSYFKLTQDISCGQIAPLARSWDSGNDQLTGGYDGFTGNFDGNNKSIAYNVTANPGNSCQALFCYMHGTVHNLTLSGSVSGTDYVGALAGIVGGGTSVTHISSAVTITVGTGNGYVGGLAGQACEDNQACTFDDNSVSGTITINSSDSAGFTGGLIGVIVGNSSQRTFSRNQHTGSISVTSVHAGGGIGGLYGYDSDVMAVQSRNTGNITVTATDPSNSQVYETGGIFGSGFNIGATDSYNSGNIVGAAAGLGGTGGHAFGGIAGYGVTLHLERTYNSGDVTFNGSGLYFEGIGGLAGFVSDDVAIIRSFTTGHVSSNATSASVTGAVIGDAPDGLGPMAATYFDIARSAQTICVGNASPAGCGGVNSGGSQPDYFFTNSTNTPLASWDFTSVWQTNCSALPTLPIFEAQNSCPSAPSQSQNTSKAAPSGVTIIPIEPSTTSPETTQILLDDFSTFLSETGTQLSDLAVGQQVVFSLPQGTTTEKHSVTINQIGTDFVVVTLASKPIKATLHIGQTELYDLTGDGKDDIQLTLNKITRGVADISFKNIGKKSARTTSTATADASKATSHAWIWYVVGGTLVVASLIVGFIIWRHRRRNRFISTDVGPSSFS
ncbi:MAG TPA: hypothetical protein VLH84_02495 [Patescibacteria group bacterium]|nr:hypothetical protein [Patescibacteria group bacterium]